MNQKVRNFISIIFLGMAGGSIYCLPYLKYVFYDKMILAMNINDQKLGLLMSVYAIACIIVYIPGGVISDRVSSKKSIIYSLLVTTVFTVIYGIFPSAYYLALGIWFLFAFTTIFLCWPAIMKTVRMLGKETGVGTAYGTYYAVNGLTGGVINTIALTVYGHTAKDSAFFWAMMVFAFFTLLVPIILFFLLKEEKGEEQEQSGNAMSLGDLKIVLKNPQIWLISLILFCTYSVYTGVTYFNPFLGSVFHLSSSLNETLTIIRTFVFMILAPLSGYMADKFFHSTLKWFLVGLSFTAIPVFFMMYFMGAMSSTSMIVVSMIPAFFMSGLYSIMFSIINECQIPMRVAGTAIGVASLFMNLPDLIIHTFFGNLLDTYGEKAWSYIFDFMVLASVVAFIACVYLIIKRKKQTVEPEQAVSQPA